MTAGQTTVCTLTNTRKADLAVTKTEGGSTTLSRTWTFTLSGGPDQIELTRSTADGNPVGFGSLAPGEYTLCEVDLPDGWHSSLGVAAGGKVCTQLQLAAGESGEFTVDNTTPAIGLLKQVRRAGDEAWQKVATLQVGQAAQYLLTVTNEGVGPLVGVDVADDRSTPSRSTSAVTPTATPSSTRRRAGPTAATTWSPRATAPSTSTRPR